MLAVVDVKKFFGLAERGLVRLNRIVVLRGEQMEFGLLADEILGVERIAVARIEPPVAPFTGIRRDYLIGVGPGSLVVLDAHALLNDERLVIHGDAQV